MARMLARKMPNTVKTTMAGAHILAFEQTPPRAMVEDSAGLGFILLPGTPIGPNGGVVTEIKPRQVVVEEWPTSAQDPTGTGLLGLYEGVNLHDRASGYSGFLPDRITVFMGPHLALRLPPRRLGAQIRKTVLHEVAHHLGIDDERLGELGY